MCTLLRFSLDSSCGRSIEGGDTVPLAVPPLSLWLSGNFSRSGWSKQKSENSGLFRNFLNPFWLSYPHPHSIGPFLCRKFSLIILCILLFARVHFRISCIYEKDVQKEKVNTGMTRIFRQHKFIAFRYLNVYYKKAKPKLKSL